MPDMSIPEERASHWELEYNRLAASFDRILADPVRLRYLADLAERQAALREAHDTRLAADYTTANRD